MKNYFYCFVYFNRLLCCYFFSLRFYYKYGYYKYNGFYKYPEIKTHYSLFGISDNKKSKKKEV